MSFFSSLIKAIFTISLAFSLYSETSFSRSKIIFTEPECGLPDDLSGFCTREHDPVCAINGETYENPCLFCVAMRQSESVFGFSHFGNCGSA